MPNKLSNINSGYIGNIDEWKKFFHLYINSPYIEKYLITNFNSDDSKFNWHLLKDKFAKIMDEKPVSDKDIINLEKRLKIKLPKSYKDFLQANGVQLYNEIFFLSTTFINMLNTKKVDYFIKKDREYMKDFINSLNYTDEKYIVDNYYSYNDYLSKIEIHNGMNNPKLRSSNMALGELSFGFISDKQESYKQAITLDNSDVPSAILIPDELTADGEMEAWMLEDSEIYRFRSFAELFINNLFFEHDTPMYQFEGKKAIERESLLSQSGMTTIEYLSLYGVNKLLDFDKLKQTALPQS